MNARIRGKLEQARSGKALPVPAHQTRPNEEYFTAEEIGQRLKLHRDTIRELMRTETVGVIRIGKVRTTERYSASAVERLVHRLERGEDPRFA